MPYSPKQPRRVVPRQCPKCQQRSGLPVQVRDDEPSRVVACQNNECMYEWEEAGVNEAFRAFRAEIRPPRY